MTRNGKPEYVSVLIGFGNKKTARMGGISSFGNAPVN
jgi:hypothetical protein